MKQLPYDRHSENTINFSSPYYMSSNFLNIPSLFVEKTYNSKTFLKWSLRRPIQQSLSPSLGEFLSNVVLLMSFIDLSSYVCFELVFKLFLFSTSIFFFFHQIKNLQCSPFFIRFLLILEIFVNPLYSKSQFEVWHPFSHSLIFSLI